MAVTRPKTVVLCPDCDEQIDFRTPPKLGLKFTCPNCDASLVVTSISPLEIEWDDSDFDDNDWDTADDDDW
jgi:UDP-N-acetylmuramyl tripeptide synthase